MKGGVSSIPGGVSAHLSLAKGTSCGSRDWEIGTESQISGV